MDNEERYLDRLENRRIAESSYASLADCADDEAYDGLTDYIYDGMPMFETQDHLISIATIWQQKGTTAEKYALIGDIFQKIIDRNASNKMKGN